jgi:hypothetical protein
MLGAVLLAAPLVSGPQAWALIPNDDDEEMVEKAKANRQKRLQEVWSSCGKRRWHLALGVADAVR